jgi:hypothetical protein
VVIMPHATRRRIAGKSTQPASIRSARALAMLHNKHVEMSWRKYDNLPV